MRRLYLKFMIVAVTVMTTLQPVYSQTDDAPLEPYLANPAGLPAYNSPLQRGSGFRAQSLATSGFSTTIDPLAQRASQNNTIRVIAQVNVPGFRPEGQLAAPAIASQRAAIRAAQNQVNIPGATIIETFEIIPYMTLEVNESALRALASSPQIVAIYEETERQITLAESMAVTNTLEAHQMGYDGTNQVVAVIDTGAEATHTFFQGRVVAEACFSSTGCLNNSSVHTGAGSASPTLCEGIDGCLHGTHVSGAVLGENESFRGTASGAELVAIYAASTVYDPFTQEFGLVFPDTNLLGALQYVYDLKVQGGLNIVAVNLSLGTSDLYNDSASCDTQYGAYKTMFDQLLSVNIVPVAASGNSYTSAFTWVSGISHPGCSASTVSVGATDTFDNVASFSNSGAPLDTLAPGAYITSSGLNNTYAVLSGTSMATPQVAGMLAVLRQQNPNLTVQQFLDLLSNTGRSITDQSGITRNRIDLEEAVLSQEVDQLDTIGTFTTESGEWELLTNNLSNATEVPEFTYGKGGVPVTGDWNNDGIDTIGVFYASTGGWYLRNSNAGGNPDIPVFNYGKGGVPVTGDWDGNGTDTVGVFYPSSGGWYLRNSNTLGNPDVPVFTYGKGGTPVVGDWDGNGTDTVGVFYPSTGDWYLRNSNSGGNAHVTFRYGSGGMPVTGDWNSSGTDTIGVFYYWNGSWYLRNSNSGGNPHVSLIGFGINDKPIAGNWDGNQMTSMAAQMAGIQALSIIDLDSGTRITTLQSGATLTDLPENIQIVAEAFGGDTIVFDYQSVEVFTTDTEAPFTLTGDAPTVLAGGEHTLTATLYVDDAPVDTYTVTFTVE